MMPIRTIGATAPVAPLSSWLLPARSEGSPALAGDHAKD
jgi:hypothetical protein